MHLNQSSQNSNFCAISNYNKISKQKDDYSFISFSINLPSDPYYRLIDKDCHEIVGSCNGLVCLLGYSLTEEDNDEHKEKWLRIWNPATRTISDKLEYFIFSDDKYYFCKFLFGYDNTTDTYKVVALHMSNDSTTEVQILSFGENIWRNIGSFTGMSLQSFYFKYGWHGGVHLNCTVNWLAYIYIMDVDDFRLGIISLDMGTETHTNLLHPPVFLEVSLLQKGVCVLMNSLCFYHDLKGTYLVIWKMTKFGDEKSWTQFFKFRYQILQINFRCGNLFEYGDTLVFTEYLEDQAILYNWRNNRVVKQKSVDEKIHWFSVMNYVESLVSTC
ncbi:F-box/kelch-repeat protein At3g23880-like [Trifolium pratense]|uniref:F-box/kelch-repeat protein At3g23880-like n=1 Tax=Trifolium pratense TaxID=57577 RepID=UPI001E692D3E|nr:F-box/kelch-repeat protein At3g23880-like [Trifolium pratense]